MRKPLICPIAYPDESPCSLLLRASESNDWKSPDAFISAYGVHSSKKTYSLHSLITNKNHWQKVCKVLGIINRVKCYEKMKVSRGSNYDFLGNFVKYKSLKLKEPSICPDCLHEKKYISSMFDHRLITACSIHHIKLLSECPACKEKLKWSRKGLLTCSCGHQLDSFKSISADTTVTQYIEEVIQNKDVSTLDLIFKFFEAFEVFFKNINIATDQHQLVELAGKSLLEKQKVINLLSKHVKKTARLYGLHPRLILSPFLSSSEQEINELASSTLKRLVKSKITLGKTLNSIDFHVNKVSARKVLGISSFLTEELINNSLLEVKQQAKHRVQKITISSINELLILFTSTTKSNKPKISYKALGHYSGKNVSHRISLVNLIQKIKSNEVKVVGVNFSSGILSAKVYIKPIKVKKYDYITMTDVAKICGVHQESIRFAVWSVSTHKKRKELPYILKKELPLDLMKNIYLQEN